MELRIRPFHKNTYPFGGFLIKNPSVSVWLKEIQSLNFSLQNVQIFPISDIIPNSIWGCFVLTTNKLTLNQVGKNEICQQIAANLFIAEKSILQPELSPNEIEKLFSKNIHVFHPDFGLIELTEELNLEKILSEPTLKSFYITKPNPPVFIPKQINSFQVKPVPPEEVLKNMEEKIFPKQEKMKDEPLSAFEHLKLGFYKTLFSKSSEKREGAGESVNIKKSDWWTKLESLFKGVGKEGGISEKMQQDFEDLEKRNQKQMDKLMDLFKNNPDEALKYAIPLDDNGSSRGGTSGQFEMSKRWTNFSLLGDMLGGKGSGGGIDMGDHYFTLQKQYSDTALEFIKQKQFHKAAFVYMKLLKNPHQAAETLATGEYYQEAAGIFLKHSNNKKRAAECYEKGNMTGEAIEIYKDLGENEMVGDLYVKIKKRREADTYYGFVIDDYKSKSQYVKASLIYKNKMNNERGGQSMLLQGWRVNADAFNCLNNYFANISDIKELKTEIDAVYNYDVSPQNRESFLRVIKHEFDKKNELSDSIKEMAYEIVAAQIPTNPTIVSELKGFNPKDQQLTKDTIRFNLKNKQSLNRKS